MFGMFGGGAPRRFEGHYRVYPVTFIDKPEAERGDKVFLPPSALDRLASLHVEYPMLFQVENRATGATTHCGVLEFIADEGMVYMPYWMMQNLGLAEGDVAALRSAALPKGEFVKLRPHSVDFLDISNPRAVLETTLRAFSCLSVGDTVPVHYNGRVYRIDIVEARPGDAVSVIETDCNVDFAPPLDYVEPARGGGGGGAAAAAAPAAAPAAEPMATDGAARAPAPAPAPEEPKFLAFSGSGRRLDGKPVGESAPVAIPLARVRPTAVPSIAPAPAAAAAAEGGSAPRAGSAKAGKLMFKDRLAAKYGDGKGGGGAAGGAGAAPPPPPKPADEKKDEAPKFQAFSGKGFSLQG